MDHPAKNTLDLNRLRARVAEKPRTKAGQIRQAWPEIKALFAVGHSLKDVWMWLNEIGIEIGYARLSDYTSQLKRRDRSAALAAPPLLIHEEPLVTTRPHTMVPETVARESLTEAEPPAPYNDPLANIREREDRRPGFQYNPEPDVKKLI